MSSDLARRLDALERASKIGVLVIDPTGLPPWTRDVWPPWRRAVREPEQVEDDPEKPLNGEP